MNERSKVKSHKFPRSERCIADGCENKRVESHEHCSDCLITKDVNEIILDMFRVI